MIKFIKKMFPEDIIKVKYLLTLYFLTSVVIAQINNNSFELKIKNVKVDYKYEEVENFDIINFTGASYSPQIGDFLLPRKRIIVAIPPNSNPEIEIIKKNVHKIENCVPKKYSSDDSTGYYQIKKLNRPSLLQNSFPSSDFTLIGFAWINQFYCAVIEVYPYRFYPNGNFIDFMEDFVLRFKFNKNYAIKSEAPIQNKKRIDLILKQIFINSGMAEQFRKSPPKKLLTNDDWIDFDKEYIKLSIEKDGLYRIYGTDLKNWGYDLSTLDYNQFKLFNKGKQIPIQISGIKDNLFEEKDYIEFYGERNYGSDKYRMENDFGQPYNEYLNRYSNNSILWLSLTGNKGLRISEQEFGEDSKDTLDWYTKLMHFEKDKFFVNNERDIVEGESTEWLKNETWVEGGLGVETINLPFDVDMLVKNENAKAIHKFVYYASSVLKDAYILGLNINNNVTDIDTFHINKYENKVASIKFNSNLLSNGTNYFKITSYPTDNIVNKIDRDWYEIEYPRFLEMEDSVLIFQFDSTKIGYKTIKLRGSFNLDEYSLYRIKPSLKKINFLNTYNNFSTFSDTIFTNNKYILEHSSKVLSPNFLSKKYINEIYKEGNKGQYIIITNKILFEKAKQYEEFIKSSYDVSTSMFDVEDIYDVFNYGYMDPEAIKDFLIYVNSYWADSKPEYLLIMGDSNYDYKNNLNLEKYTANIVPSFGHPVSDTWFTIWDNVSLMPQLFVGRLPVNTPEEVENYLMKHKNYINSEFDVWNKSHLLLSGGQNESDQTFCQSVNNRIMNNLITPAPTAGFSNHFYATTTPQTNFGPYDPFFIDSVFTSGNVIISFIGHSGTRLWDNGIEESEQLNNNRDKNSFITDYGCSTGKFSEPDIDSFSEINVVRAGGQAIGYIGNSSLGFTSTVSVFPEIFYKNIYKNEIFNLGEVHTLSKIELINNYGLSSVNKIFLYSNELISDPIINLRIPQLPNLAITNSAVEIMSHYDENLDSVKIGFIVNNFGRADSSKFSIKIIQKFNQEIVLNKVIESVTPLRSEKYFIWIPIKNLTGNHSLEIDIDPDNLIPELNENDNIALVSFNVVSSDARPIIFTNQNSNYNSIKFLSPLFSGNDSINIFIADNASFKDKINLIKGIDTIATKINFSNLRNGERYWVKTTATSDTNIKLNEFTFTYDDNNYPFTITDSISLLNNSLNGIEYQNGIFKLSHKEISIILSSEAYSSSGTGHIIVDGKEVMNLSQGCMNHVAVLNGKTLKVENYSYFNYWAPSPHSYDDYYNFLNSIDSTKIVLFVLSQECAGYSLSSEIKEQIRSFGSRYVDLIKMNRSWIMIGKRGSKIGTVPELFSDSSKVEIDTILTRPIERGNITTRNFKNNIQIQRLEINSSEVNSNTFVSAILYNNQTDTMALSPNSLNFYELNELKSENFDSLKFLIELIDTNLTENPNFNDFKISLNLPPELAINYQVVSTSTDSIWQGNPIDLNFDVYNVGESAADSFNVIVNLVKSDNSKKSLFDTLVTRIDSMGKSSFHLNYPTNFTDGFGDMAFEIKIDTSNTVLELFEDNNYYQQSFYVIEDTITNVTAAEVSVLFDGSQVFDGSYINPNPTISTYLDYQPLYQYDDTTQIKFFIDGERYYLSQMDSVRYDTVEKRISYIFSPQLEDGDHSLKIEGTDIFNSENNSEGYFVNFMVSSELKLLDVYNYPNPVISETHFTCKLTQIPDEMSIKIYTIAGRLIKEFNIDPNELSLDFNRIYWDTRDEDGDLVANGVYLYKLTVKNKDKTLSQTQKLAIVR